MSIALQAIDSASSADRHVCEAVAKLLGVGFSGVFVKVLNEAKEAELDMRAAVIFASPKLFVDDIEVAQNEPILCDLDCSGGSLVSEDFSVSGDVGGDEELGLRFSIFPD